LSRGPWSLEGVETALLDAVHKLARFAGSGNEVVPAASDVRFRIEAENALADGIAVMVVIEEPAVEVRIAQSGLNCFQVHGEIVRQ